MTPAKPGKTPSGKRAGKRTATAAGASAQERQAGVLEPIFDAIRKRTGRAGGEDASAFAGAFYRRMTEDELPVHDAEGWAALADDLLAFAHRRKPGTALVRLFNPARDSHGWESPRTVLQIVNDDMPFLVDSVTMALADAGVGVHVLGHPVIQIARDKAGRLTGVGDGETESVMHLEIDRQTAEGMAAIEATVNQVLEDVRAIVHDWAAMRGKMQQVATELADRRLPVDAAERAEAQEFLRWAANDHFTFFGYREYQLRQKGGQELLVPVEGSGLGLLRGVGDGKGRPLKSLAAHNVNAGGDGEVLVLTKTNARSTVHRPGYMDYIGVLGFDEQGRAVSEQRFLGLYTSGAYNRRPWDIPLVRERYEHVMSESGLKPTGHSGKALKHILETLPRDELFQCSEQELYRLATGVLGLQERVRSRLFLRRDRYGRFYSVLVYIPRDRFSTEVRRRVEAMLRRVLHADHVDANVAIGESPLAQVHLIVRPRGGEQVEVDQALLERELAVIVRNWQDDLREALVARHGEEQGLALANRYGRALPAGYIEGATPAIAATDVERLAALGAGSDLELSLQELPSPLAGETALRFKLYRSGGDIALSDALPMMENLGLRVVTEHPYRLDLDDAPLYIQDFEVEAGAAGIDVDQAGADFTEAFARLWRGDAENDGLNRLVLGASLDWRQVALLRAYAKYLLQVGVPFSQSYVEDAFTRNPLIARVLVELGFDGARVSRFLDWAEDVRPPQESQGNRIVWGKRAADGTVLEQLFADAKPEFTLARKAGDDEQTLEAAEGLLRMTVLEQPSASAEVPTYDVTLQVEAARGRLVMQVKGDIAGLTGKLEAAQLGAVAALEAATEEHSAAVGEMEAALGARIDGVKGEVEATLEEVSSAADALGGAVAAAKAELAAELTD